MFFLRFNLYKVVIIGVYLYDVKIWVSVIWFFRDSGNVLGGDSDEFVVGGVVGGVVVIISVVFGVVYFEVDCLGWVGVDL